MYVHIKPALSQSALSRILPTYYYAPCSSCPGKAPCRSTWQYKYNKTLKYHALSCHVPSYKKTALQTLSFWVSLGHLHTHKNHDQVSGHRSTWNNSWVSGKLTSEPKLIPYDLEGFGVLYCTTPPSFREPCSSQNCARPSYYIQHKALVLIIG